MFVIKTEIGPSAIHGTGVFACEPLAPGELVWRYHPALDQVVSDDALVGLPDAVLQHLQSYAYRSSDLGGKLVLSGDHAKFLNHDPDPNTEERPFVSVARKLIRVGDEITCDYGAFCEDWAGLENEKLTHTRPPRGTALAGEADIGKRLPHGNLYTRLHPSPNGVGVFAIRKILEGTLLFVGDTGPTARVPVKRVEQIEDYEIRRMYFDFCPVVRGAFVAPADFNQLTMGWYMNHSDNPNVVADSELGFSACRTIHKGEELTANYTTYSEHAAAFVHHWGE